jgi:hypothetical protein
MHPFDIISIFDAENPSRREMRGTSLVSNGALSQSVKKKSKNRK